MPARHSSARLDVERSDGQSQQLELGTAPVLIGRARRSDVQVAGRQVARRHAEIVREDAGYCVVDLGSDTGLLVNGRRVMRRSLGDGDVIELGYDSPVRMTFRAEARSSEPSVASTEGKMSMLARFFEFSRKLGGSLAPDAVLQDVLDLAIEITGAERGAVLLLGADRALATRMARAAKGTELPIEGLEISLTLARQAIDQRVPRIVGDVDQDIDLANQASIVSLELRSAVVLPLTGVGVDAAASEGSAEHVIGVIYLDSRKRHARFGEFDLEILTRLSKDASSVVENARLLQEAESRRRLERELEVARKVQETLVPARFESCAAFDVAGLFVPCHELGGDYVDQFDLGDGRQALVIADVAGKGIAASLLAASLQGALAAEMARGHPLGEIVARANRVHGKLAPADRFVSMAVALLEPDGRLQLVNAGHCPPLLVRADGVVAVGEPGMALGLDDDARYAVTELQLAAGDALILFTDGVVECEAEGQEQFGQRRLEQLLAHQHGRAAPDLLGDIRTAVEEFRGDIPPSDDLTVLVARRL